MRTQRWWHVAENKASCDNYTSLMSQDKPSSLCSEVGTSFCVCSTRTQPGEGATAWQFRCGTCGMKWRRNTAHKSKMLSQKQRKNEKKQQRRNTNMNKKKAYM